MKLGLLGFDDRIAEVIAAATAAGDTVVIGCDLPTAGPLADMVVANLPRDPSWEPLLDPQCCDAVLVGVDGWNDARAVGVRARAGRTHVAAFPPAGAVDALGLRTRHDPG